MTVMLQKIADWNHGGKPLLALPSAATEKTERGDKHVGQLRRSLPAGEKVDLHFGKLFDSIYLI